MNPDRAQLAALADHLAPRPLADLACVRELPGRWGRVPPSRWTGPGVAPVPVVDTIRATGGRA